MRALLLDFDGTVADTLPALRREYAAFLEEHGLSGDPRAAFEEMNGRPVREIMRILKEERGLEGELAALARDYGARIAVAAAHAPPTAGAQALLERAAAAGFRVAIVTSAPQQAARRWLERVGFADDVDVVVGGDDVEAPKPDPAPYRRALELLRVKPGDALAVEDAPLGALAALRAGVMTYALCVAPARDEVPWPDGVRFVASLDEVPTPT